MPSKNVLWLLLHADLFRAGMPGCGGCLLYPVKPEGVFLHPTVVIPPLARRYSKAPVTAKQPRRALPSYPADLPHTPSRPPPSLTRASPNAQRALITPPPHPADGPFPGAPSARMALGPSSARSEQLKQLGLPRAGCTSGASDGSPSDFSMDSTTWGRAVRPAVTWVVGDAAVGRFVQALGATAGRAA